MDSTNQSLDDLREIRNIMERSTRFLSLSGLSGISAGIIALVGAAVAFFFLDYDQRYFNPQDLLTPRSIRYSSFVQALTIDGAIVLMAALITSFYFTFRKARRNGLPLWDPSSRRLLIALSFPLVSGGIFCLVLISHDLIYLLAPATLIFYGLGLISAGHFTLRELNYLGISEIVLGLIASVLTEFGLIFWAAGFGLLHIIYGFRMYYKYER